MIGAYLPELKEIVLKQLAGVDVKIYLFGSYAKGTARSSSDVDIAILPSDHLPASILVQLRDKLEESTIPYFVDVVDLSKVDKNFREQVLSEAILWKN